MCALGWQTFARSNAPKWLEILVLIGSSSTERTKHTKQSCIKGSEQLSGSSQRGRCRRGRSEIPHFSCKLQLFAPCSRIKRKKSEEKRKKRGDSRRKRGDSRRKRGDSRQKAKKKGRFPPAPSTPTPLRTSQN